MLRRQNLSAPGTPSNCNRPSRWKRIAMMGILGIVLPPLIAGCSSSQKKSPVKKAVRHDWFYPTRSRAPEPVYSEIREVRPPQPIPRPPRDVGTSPRIFPVVQLNLHRASMAQVATALGRSYNYGHYCAPTIENFVVSIRALGTLDELAQRVADVAMVTVVVDHENREVQILGTPPRRVNNRIDRTPHLIEHGPSLGREIGGDTKGRGR